MSSKHVRKDSVTICVVCCEDIEFYATGACDHSVCYKCCVRMRVLGKETYCPVCRTELEQVFLTKDCRTSYQRLASSGKSFSSDRRHGIRYQGKEVQDAVKALMQHCCPFCPDHPVERYFDHLRDHVRKVHERFYCDLCATHLQKFTFERRAYTRQELARHRRVGDTDDKSHKGHPLCEFCDQRYLDNDELHRHLRKDHFWCHFCERDGGQDYFSNYQNLRAHFRDRHFLCEEGDCLHEKFTSVFRDKVDLQAHRATKHSRSLTKAQARQARQLDVDITFAPRPRPQTNQSAVVTGRDFMEVRSADQKQGKRNKGRAKGEASKELENRKEALDTQTAMALSLIEPLADDPSKLLPSPSSKPQEPKKYKPEDNKNKGEFSVNEQSSHFPTLLDSLEDSSMAEASKDRKIARKSPTYGNILGSGPVKSREDFPSLSASAKIPEQPLSIPPGFAAAACQPPMLPISRQTNRAKPPPGYQKPLAVAVKERIKENVAPTHIPAKPEAKIDSVQERNQALVDKIRGLLTYDKAKFDMFKALSGKFRQGTCSAKEYYDHCCDLFGSNFSQVFSELVDLLPDPEKRRELLLVHQDTKVTAKQKGEHNKPPGKVYKNPPQMSGVWPEASGPTTRYVEAPSKGASGVSERDFPALPTSSKRTFQPSYKSHKSAAVLKDAWVRGK